MDDAHEAAQHDCVAALTQFTMWMTFNDACGICACQFRQPRACLSASRCCLRQCTAPGSLLDL